MDDIRPPKRPLQPRASRPAPSNPRPANRPPAPRPTPLNHRLAAPAAEPLIEAHSSEIPVAPSSPTPPLEVKSASSSRKRWSWRRWLLLSVSVLLVVMVGAGIAGYVWYTQQLEAVSNDKNSPRVHLTVEAGSTPSQISTLLTEKKLIRHKTAFDIYTRVNGLQAKLQAGSYRLSAAESTPEIVKHLVSGNVDQFSITFYPGATLTDTSNKADNKKVDVTTILKRAGYSEREIAAALKKSYTHPVLASKPATADLEGYVYGETYNFPSSASVEDILRRTFDELHTQVTKHKITDALKTRGMTLHEGIILASIIQREEQTLQDQRQVAQVFLNRLKIDMPLGSDPTYQYAAQKLGVVATPDLDSPYNTRKYGGLPPGPIATPNITALQALIDPLPNDYLYFLSGDDNKLYFGRTIAEHEQNIRTHCQVKCFSY